MNTDLSTLTEAKKIYTNQLCKLLQPQIYKGLLAIWSLCKDSDECLKNFQRKLEHIPRWNSMIIDDEYRRIVDDTKCEYIDKLLDATFIANAKILSVLNRSSNNLDISVPGPKKFLHSCYISCAYKFFSDPFLFDDREKGNMDYRKKQKNMKEVMHIINSCISETIENLLPIEDLLKSCLEEKKEEIPYKTSLDDDILDTVGSSEFDNSGEIPDNDQSSEEEKDDKPFTFSSIDVTTEKEPDDSEMDNMMSDKIVPKQDNFSPDLDIVEGKNLYDANKNHLLVEDSNGKNNGLLISEKEMKRLDEDYKDEISSVGSSSSSSSGSDIEVGEPVKNTAFGNTAFGNRKVTFFDDI
jgi:Family of unknown function (DUF5764)